MPKVVFTAKRALKKNPFVIAEKAKPAARKL